jgi:transposase
MSHRGERRIPVTDDQVVVAYRRHQSAYTVARRLGISTTTVYLILKRNAVPRVGLALHRKRAAAFTPDVARQVADAYRDGASIPELVARFGGAVGPVRKAIERAGIPFRPAEHRPSRRTGEVERIVRLRLEGMSQAQICATVGRSQAFVSKVLVRSGVGGRLCCLDCGSRNIGTAAKKKRRRV